jgi:kynurenine formamidase
MCSPLIMQKVRAEVSRRGVLRFAGAMAATGLAASVARVAAQDATPMASPVATGPGALGVSLGSYTQIQDLTHTITPMTPVFPGYPQPAIEPIRTYETDGYYANKLTYAEHSGTHMDAPAHFIEGELFADQLPVERFLAPLAVIDISERAASDPDAQVTPDDILAWEEANGPLPAGAFVAMNSGWDAKINDPDAFINADADGVLHFPGFHPDATMLLLDEREITGIGVDTLSLDYGASTDFGTHIALLGSGRYGVEGLASLGTVPATGGLIIVGGPKFLNASGGPSRVLALYS